MRETLQAGVCHGEDLVANLPHGRELPVLCWWDICSSKQLAVFIGSAKLIGLHPARRSTLSPDSVSHHVCQSCQEACLGKLRWVFRLTVNMSRGITQNSSRGVVCKIDRRDCCTCYPACICLLFGKKVEARRAGFWPFVS